MDLLRAPTLCLIAGAGLLGACSKPAANSAAGGVVISQADLPKLKPGLWEISVSNDGKPPTIAAPPECETGETMIPKDIGKACSQFVFKRTFLGAIVIDAVCAMGGASTTMHMTIHGDFNGDYTGDSQVTLTVAGQPTRTFTTHSESKYLGPCPPGG